jgi:purine-binding chemotaxis protein CheW
LVTVAGRTIGLVVDDVLGKITVPTGDFRPPPELGGGEQARGISGVTTHEGDLVFVLDLATFETLAESFDHRSIAPAQAPREERR